MPPEGPDSTEPTELPRNSKNIIQRPLFNTLKDAPNFPIMEFISAPRHNSVDTEESVALFWEHLAHGRTDLLVERIRCAVAVARRDETLDREAVLERINTRITAIAAATREATEKASKVSAKLHNVFLEKPISKLGLSDHTAGCLQSASIETLKSLTEHTCEQLLQIHGIEEEQLQEIRGALALRGQALFADPLPTAEHTR